MSEREARRGAGGAPFYVPPRRKTSAEIISEARAAIRGDMSAPSSGSSLGALRPLRTRRPFTPRDSQRAHLDRYSSKHKSTRPPSAFDLKYPVLEESYEDSIEVSGALVAGLDDDELAGVFSDTYSNSKKKPLHRNKSLPQPEKTGKDWSSFTKLPHLSGKSKPLHRRNTTANDGNSLEDLSEAISVTQPVGACASSGDGVFQTTSMTVISKSSPKRQLASGKAASCDVTAGGLGDVPVRHLSVQLPKTTQPHLHSMNLLEISEALSQRCRSVDRTRMLLDELLNRVVTSPPAGSLRELVLRSVYTHVDSDDNRILVTIARVMLTMQVTGPHLTAACKLVYKISRNDNTASFQDNNLLELMVEGWGRVEPVSESTSCACAAAALRTLTLHAALCERAHRAGALPLAALHLKMLTTAKAERPRQISEEAINALYQVTGVLRSLANASEHLHTFVSSGALGELLHALRIHTDRDVLTNVARCLSVASGDTSCCSWLCACADSAGALLRALAACASRASLAVRLAYTLGNMAAGDQQARINIYNEEGSLDVLLTILESYTKRSTVAVESRDLGPDPDLHLVGSDLVGSDGSNEDVLIKTVRVIANLCLADSVGTGVAGSYGERTIRALLACLEVAEKSYYSEMSVTHDNEDDQYDRCDELAVAALATLNNVTFYLEPPPSPRRIDDTIDMLCKATCRWAQGSGLAACEAVRALGNLSRSARAAQVLELEGALDLLPRFHTHEDASVRCSAAGLLVNVCGAGGGAAGGAAAATALAGSARRGDAPTAALLARALWNAHAHHPLDQQHSALATQSLALFIDDDSVFTPCEAIGGSQTSERKQHVKFGLAQDCEEPNSEEQKSDLEVMINGHRSDGEEEDVGYSTEDLEFEEGEGCVCASCKRLAGWEELVAVALPLLEALQPSRVDAAVGTD
ncbi:armadillo repeat-containing protein 2 [Leptidea sinapis]|uniref:armadillo repeat-containing protein 2 n=1 Tax=Leptidea sinapis TaxID=189913 RepID=UPI0021400160|nr:armadillo repeat-containing protein 2 [Leptidea sinapis]